MRRSVVVVKLSAVAPGQPPQDLGRQPGSARFSCMLVMELVQLRRALEVKFLLRLNQCSLNDRSLGDIETGSRAIGSVPDCRDRWTNHPWGFAARRMTRPDTQADADVEICQGDKEKSGVAGTIRRNGSLDSLSV